MYAYRLKHGNCVFVSPASAIQPPSCTACVATWQAAGGVLIAPLVAVRTAEYTGIALAAVRYLLGPLIGPLV